MKKEVIEEIVEIEKNAPKEWVEYMERQHDRVKRTIGCYKFLKRKNMFKPQMLFWDVANLCELCDKMNELENNESEVKE